MVNQQIATIGGARRVNANNLNLDGTLNGGLFQTNVSVSGVMNTQIANIGGAYNVRARNITAQGSVNGAVTQVSASAGSSLNLQSAVVGGVQGADVSGNDEEK